MSKFAEKLSASNKDIKSDRAEMLAEEVALEVNQFVGNLKKERLSLKNKVNRLTDLAPDSKDSLRPANKDFDASQWVSELHDAKMKLKLKEISLKVATDIEKEWFSDSDEK